MCQCEAAVAVVVVFTIVLFSLLTWLIHNDRLLVAVGAYLLRCRLWVRVSSAHALRSIRLRFGHSCLVLGFFPLLGVELPSPGFNLAEVFSAWWGWLGPILLTLLGSSCVITIALSVAVAARRWFRPQ